MVVVVVAVVVVVVVVAVTIDKNFYFSTSSLNSKFLSHI